MLMNDSASSNYLRAVTPRQCSKHYRIIWSRGMMNRADGLRSRASQVDRLASVVALQRHAKAIDISYNVGKLPHSTAFKKKELNCAVAMASTLQTSNIIGKSPDPNLLGNRVHVQYSVPITITSTEPKNGLNGKKPNNLHD